MGLFIKGVEMPKDEAVALYIYPDGRVKLWRPQAAVSHEFEAVPVPTHGDLIDRDALIKDGWSILHKEVMRMGGYAIHEMPLNYPDIPTIIPADPA